MNGSTLSDTLICPPKLKYQLQYLQQTKKKKKKTV